MEENLIQDNETINKKPIKDIHLRELLPKDFLINIDSNFKQFCKGIRKNLRMDNYEIIGVTGYPGTGKSQLVSIMGCLIDENYSFNRNINFIPTSTEVEKDYLKLPMYSFLHIDEASRSIHKHKWYEKTQQKLSTLYDSVSKDTEICFYDKEEFKRMKIENMYKIYGENPKELKTFVIDDKFKIYLKPIESILQRPIRQPSKRMFKIKTRFNKEIIITEDHSVFVFKNRGEKIHKISPTELKIKDKLILPKILPSLEIINEDNDKMQLYGSWLADGCYQITKNEYNSIKLSGKEHKELLERIAKKYPNKYNISRVRCYNGIDYIFSNRELINEMLLKGFIGNSYTKRVPSWVFNTSKDNKISFLKGFMTGDGSINFEGRSRVSSVNKELLRDIQILLMMIGIPTGWTSENRINHFKEYSNGTISNHLEISTHFHKQYEMLFESSKKNYNLLKDFNPSKGNMISKRHEKYLKEDCVCSAIISIEEIFNYEGNVYDLSIKDIHRFIGNDILVSNTEREYHCLCSVLIMPRFQNFTENFRNFFIKYWINIVCRGIAIVYKRDEDKDTKDPWNVDLNMKLKMKYWKGKRIFERSIPDIIRMEQKTKNYWFYFKIPEIPQDVWSEYQKLKSQSRVTMRESEANLETASYKERVELTKIDRWKKIVELRNQNKTYEQMAVILNVSSNTIRKNMREIEAYQSLKGEVYGVSLKPTDTSNNIYNLNDVAHLDEKRLLVDKI